MKLRAKILAVIASLMAILYVLLAAAILPELASMGVEARNLHARAAVMSIASMLETFPRERRRELVQERRDLLTTNPPPALWAVTDDKGRVVAWSRSEAPPGKLEERLDYEQPISPVRPGEPAWMVHVKAPPPQWSFDRGLWALFLVMLVGTVMLAVAVYGMTLRLVIKPVERLAAASRAGVHGKGVLPRVPTLGRNDEMGTLVASYNAMVDEVNDLRVNLEKRVQSAVSELETAQRKLIVSERLSATGKLAAGVAHEINNPLAGMLNAARSLRKRAEPGTREAEYLELIEDGIARVQGIVATMLHAARPAEGRASLDLREAFEGALLFCKHRIENAGVELERAFPEDGQARVLGNRAEMGQVFLNLIVNALDAMEEKDGPRRLSLALAREDGKVLACVRDTGKGMSPETRAQAGELFFSTKNEGKGTGLGLAIVKHIVAEHSGELLIESQEGGGTTVSVRLPAEEHA